MLYLIFVFPSFFRKLQNGSQDYENVFTLVIKYTTRHTVQNNDWWDKISLSIELKRPF